MILLGWFIWMFMVDIFNSIYGGFRSHGGTPSHHPSIETAFSMINRHKPTIFGYLDQLKGVDQNPLRQTGGCLKTQRESHIQISTYPLVMTNSLRLKMAH